MIRKLNKDAILHETHYGITIYSHILRCYYPGEVVLSLAGTKCALTKNPFAENKRSLEISILNNCARHLDHENAIPPGDVFDFAAIHYKLEGTALLQKINEELNLHIGEDRSFYNRAPYLSQPVQECPELKNTEIPQFSFYKHPVTNVIPSGIMNLTGVYELLRSDKYKNRTLYLRSMANKTEARYVKAVSFDYVTFSGIFSKRSDKEILSHSGLMTIDFDHVSNIPDLKQKLLSDEYFETEMLFISPSGDGLKWIISVDLNNLTHQDYFKAVSAYILDKYKLLIDNSGKDKSRACFLPYDPDVFINPFYLNFKI